MKYLCQIASACMLTVILLGTVSLGAQTKETKPAPPTTATIKGSGCVEAGAEAACLVVKDSKTKTVYNVFFPSGTKPDVGTAIAFTGAEHKGQTTCQQGKPVDVSKWSKVKTKCEAPTPKEGAKK